MSVGFIARWQPRDRRNRLLTSSSARCLQHERCLKSCRTLPSPQDFADGAGEGVSTNLFLIFPVGWVGLGQTVADRVKVQSATLSGARLPSSLCARSLQACHMPMSAALVLAMKVISCWRVTYPVSTQAAGLQRYISQHLVVLPVKEDTLLKDRVWALRLRTQLSSIARHLVSGAG